MSYLLLNAVIAIWMYRDGKQRKFEAVGWCVATVLLGCIVAPLYLAKRPLKEGEVREGGTGWNVLKNFALFWTLTMFVVGIAAMVNVSEVTSGMTSDAEKAGAGIGAALGFGFLLALWFFPMVGAVILGFFMKKSSIIEKGPTGPLANNKIKPE